MRYGIQPGLQKSGNSGSSGFSDNRIWQPWVTVFSSFDLGEPQSQISWQRWGQASSHLQGLTGNSQSIFTMDPIREKNGDSPKSLPKPTKQTHDSRCCVFEIDDKSICVSATGRDCYYEKHNQLEHNLIVSSLWKRQMMVAFCDLLK